MFAKTRIALLAIVTAVPFAAAAALFPDATSEAGQLQQSPAFLMAEAETSEQGGMMGQGDMGDMMDMMQQMSRMLGTCNKMMESELDDEQRSGGGDGTETPRQ